MTNLSISSKQKEVLHILDDKIHTEIFLGGAAGGSKSFTGCLWVLTSALKYNNSRWFIARARYKNIKQSTLLTFFEVAKLCGVIKNKHFIYNSNEGKITFINGSEIYLKDLFYYPSDPDFVSLGSTEYTGGFIDEMGEISEQAYNIMKSRVRYKLDEFGLIPKVLMGSNPCKTFVYREFYQKYKNGTLESYKAYIPSFVRDNPFISKHYIDNLNRLDPVNKARLLEGNWEYDDDPSKIFEYDSILDIFTNGKIPSDKKYCTVDVAGRGRDKTVITIWEGLYIEHIYEKKTINSYELDKILKKHQVQRSKCVIDEDGVGFGIVQEMTGVKGFVNGSKPITKKKESDKDKSIRNYANLKAQCWFELADVVSKGKVSCYKEIKKEIKTKIIEDLEHIKQKDIDKDDQPLRIVSKDIIKKDLGRSTDTGDTLMMRMYFEVKPKLSFGFI